MLRLLDAIFTINATKIYTVEERRYCGGRADKGFFITTDTFIYDTIKEATRNGPSPLDLTDSVR